jgi:hypothetical protein
VRQTAFVTGSWTPDLHLSSVADRCRLTLLGVTYGNGTTLQEASNDLLVRLFDLGLGLRSGRTRFSGDLGAPDPRVIDFLWEIGDIAARGGDIRERVFGVPAQRSGAGH